MANPRYLQHWDLAIGQQTAEGLVQGILRYVKPGTPIEDYFEITDRLKVRIATSKDDMLVLTASVLKYNEIGGLEDHAQLTLTKNKWETSDGLDPDETIECGSERVIWPKLWAGEVEVLFFERRLDPSTDEPEYKYQTKLITDGRTIEIKNHYEWANLVHYTKRMTQYPMWYCPKCKEPQPIEASEYVRGVNLGLYTDPTTGGYCCVPCFNENYRGHMQEEDPNDKL
jgi:hypothetical protein